MKTRRTIEGTSKGMRTEEAYTLSNPPRARLLHALLQESIMDGDAKEISTGESLDKVRVLVRIRGLTVSGATVVREFTLDIAEELNYLTVEFWKDAQLTLGWDGSTLRVEFVSGFGDGLGDVSGDFILYEAF